jgi:tellurite resistance protein
MTALISRHEALIYVMVTTSAADRRLSDRELARIGELISNKPVFEDFDVDRLPGIANECLAMLQAEDGISVILDLVGHALPPPLRETAYALAVEIAAADTIVRQEELVFLQEMEDALEIPKLAVAAIEHSARVRYRTG